MGWTDGDPMDGEEIPKDNDERKKMFEFMGEQKRIHPLMIRRPEKSSEEDVDKIIRKHYDELSKSEQDKDIEPMNYLLKLLKEFEGLRIYKLK